MCMQLSKAALLRIAHGLAAALEPWLGHLECSSCGSQTTTTWCEGRSCRWNLSTPACEARMPMWNGRATCDESRSSSMMLLAVSLPSCAASAAHPMLQCVKEFYLYSQMVIYGEDARNQLIPCKMYFHSSWCALCRETTGRNCSGTFHVKDHAFPPLRSWSMGTG